MYKIKNMDMTVTVEPTIAEIPATTRVRETACTRARKWMTVTVGQTTEITFATDVYRQQH
jgi:hypothetical protein